MNVSFRTSFIAILSVFAAGFPGIAKAQKLSCDSLRHLIKIVAADSTLSSIKGTVAAEGNGDEGKMYFSLASLWDALDDVRGDYIAYDKTRQQFSYHAYIYYSQTPGKELAATLKIINDCLGGGWVSRAVYGKSGDTITYLKNPANYVIITIENLKGKILIECYNDSRNGAPKCISGDCGDYFGSTHYFNEDYYDGWFIDGTRSGVGSQIFHTTKLTYKGSFIDNQVAGKGALYDQDNREIDSGIFFKGNLVKVDTSLKTCQFGDCQNGFGLKVVEGGYIVGNFKNGLSEGLSELATTAGTLYAYYKAGQANGKGIAINDRGEYTFASFVDGLASGKYEKIYSNGSSLEANIADKTGSFFNADDILIQSGGGTQTVFTEKTDPDYLELKAFAKSLIDFYGYRESNFKEISGEKISIAAEPGVERFKSKLLFQNRYAADIVAANQYMYVRVYLSGSIAAKSELAKTEARYIENLKNALGKHWKQIPGAVPGGTVFHNYDNSKQIIISTDKNKVKMEIH